MNTLIESLHLKIHVACRRKLGTDWQGRRYRDNVTRLYYVENSGAWIIIEGIKYLLTPGNLYLIPARTVFDFGCEKDFVQHWLHFNALVLDGREVFDHLTCCTKISAKRDTALPAIKKIEKLFGKEGLNNQVKANGLLMQLIAPFFAKASSIAGMEAHSLGEAAKYMNEHLGERLRVGDLAEMFFLERSHFTRLFTKQFGMPPSRYIERKRIEEACRMLADSENTLGSIADRLGFVDAFHFSKVFKRIMGNSPSAFRRFGGILP